jgi:porphobilinogen synthase
MQRFRQYRTDQNIRDAQADSMLAVQDFIYPYFVVEGVGIKQEINSLPGVFHFSIDELLKDIAEIVVLGINKIIIFGVVDSTLKDAQGTTAYQPNNLVARVVKAIKQKYPELIVITDVCLCGYTDHGHCGVVKEQTVLNDETVSLLAAMALTHAASGADFVAPSAMMDGQVAAIRRVLDEAGFAQTKILGYSAKYASYLYGPFRDAAHSAPAFGDRRTYQMDFRNTDQAVQEVAADLAEGADWVMIKPAHTYLDVIQRVKTNFPETVIVAYHVSGEYALIKAAAVAGACQEIPTALEVLTAIKRAGAQYIITYYAKHIAEVLQ